MREGAAGNNGSMGVRSSLAVVLLGLCGKLIMCLEIRGRLRQIIHTHNNKLGRGAKPRPEAYCLLEISVVSVCVPRKLAGNGTSP